MENSTLKKKIAMEIENLISISCANQQTTGKFETLHEAIDKYTWDDSASICIWLLRAFSNFLDNIILKFL